jgi:hypothetical protein
VLRDLADGSLIIEINGRRYYRLADITDPEIRRRFVGNTNALAEFAQQVSPPASPAPQAAAPTPPLPPPGPVPSVLRSRAEPAPQPTRGGVFRKQPAEAQPEETPRLSMAQEIEELLQYRLTLNPGLAQRSIHIRDALGGGVRIEVDGVSYNAIDEIPDEGARAFIQDTIREWEARQ